MNKLVIAGVGELVYDHYFYLRNNELCYRASRGGGSVWNTLLNLKLLGHKCIAAGMYGAGTPYGQLAKQELSSFGINTDNLIPLDSKISRIIFQIPNGVEHIFSDRCAICSSRPDERKIARVKTNSLETPLASEGIDYLIVDKLTKERVDLVRRIKARSPNVKAIIDVGRISYLRYVPASQIVSNLSEFDLVIINQQEALLPLARRLRIEKEKQNDFVLSLIGKNALKCIIATAGSEGAHIYGKKHIHVPALGHSNVSDPAGAGDALLANVLHYLRHDFEGIIDNAAEFTAVIKKSFKKIAPILETPGARGHIPYTEKRHPLSKFKNKSVASIKATLSEPICPFCFNDTTTEKLQSPNSSAKPKASFSKTIADLEDRILFTLERKDAISKCKELLDIEGNIFVVGTGGSFVSAFFIAQIFNERGRAFTIPIRPFDYINSNAKRTDALIIITYSGSTSDYEPVIRKATNLHVDRMVIISHSHTPRLLSFANEFKFSRNKSAYAISYSNKHSRRERGFLSIAGTLLPSLLFTTAAFEAEINQINLYSLIEEKKKKNYGEILEKLSEKIKSEKCLEIYGGGFSWSSMLDLESKLIEGNVCAVQLHEYKDFSHGRFMFSLKNQNPKIVIQVDSSPYIDKLVQVLNSFGNQAPVLIIKSKFSNLVGALEILIEIQYFVQKLTKYLYLNQNVDITKPKDIPSQGLELYHWKFRS